jgi:hypothetical protein
MKKIETKSTIISILTVALWSWLTFLFRMVFRAVFHSSPESRKQETKWNKTGEQDWKKQKLLPVGFTDLIRPWHIKVDTEKRIIEIQKRNWFLIGKDEQTFQFRTVRNVYINNHLFGADILIQVYAGKAKVNCISKKKAKDIKELLLSKDWSKPGSVDILIDTESDIVFD